MTAAAWAAGLILWAALVHYLFAPAMGTDEASDELRRQDLARAQEREAERVLYPPAREAQAVPASGLSTDELERWYALPDAERQR
jgi:hypothetical protein